MKGWRVTRHWQYYVITPVDDLKQHGWNMGCWCDPKMEQLENNFIMITHNAADEREKAEAERKALIDEVSRLFT